MSPAAAVDLGGTPFFNRTNARMIPTLTATA
jgi:hypothetical protein